MEEIWAKERELISKEGWKSLVLSLKKEELITNKEKVKVILKEKLISAIEKRIPSEKFGIFFSGGVDSSFIAAICKSLETDFICFTVGFQDGLTKEPEDIIEARKVAGELGCHLIYKIFNLSEAEQIIKRTVQILKPIRKSDVVNVGVGAVILAAAEMGKMFGIKTLFSGLGSEEIFAGYDRHSKTEDVNEECWNGLINMWGRDLVRDFNLARELGVLVKTPFLDRELVEYVMQFPAEWKINEEMKKIILREAAEEFLGEFAWRKKKAAQYGSCFDKAIGKLSKKEGFKFKKDYLESL